MQNVTGKTTNKKNRQKIVSDIYIFFFSRLFVVTLLRYEYLEKPLLAG